MYIIIVGGGQVGYYLAKALLDEEHEVLVIERDDARTNFINDELGSICVRGDGCEAATLADVGTERADMFNVAQMQMHMEQVKLSYATLEAEKRKNMVELAFKQAELQQKAAILWD